MKCPVVGKSALLIKTIFLPMPLDPTEMVKQQKKSADPQKMTFRLTLILLSPLLVHIGVIYCQFLKGLFTNAVILLWGTSFSP